LRSADTGGHLIRIVPKGLRAFEAIDADFFLELVPGPRDRDGLPDSVRFWKTRLEETDPDETFRVGLLYGPSGCGKSSLVKAGLLPRLAGHVVPVYVEAAPTGTEGRLLKGIRRHCPGVPAGLGLTLTLATLRRRHGLSPGKKILLVIDQFEQWLHANREYQAADLVQALRQCDGEHVQALVLVRDDFWMATTRFMRELEVPLVEGKNSAAVDLFDLRHARRVMTAYGRAFGALPDGALLPEQQRFVDQAVAGLARDNKVISVRLSLFATLVKDRSWTPTTLKEVGGAEGVGVTFLEETFSAPTAPPEHRRHQKGVRAILRALLPEAGTEIKGHMRSYQDLLEGSVYKQRPAEFQDVMRMLDSELRLVTPTDPEGEEEGGRSKEEAGEPSASSFYYQLTHDYLVPVIRRWLTRKQKETWRGRAELRLEERAAQWSTNRQSRFLPSLPEFLVSWAGVPRSRQKAQERALMKAAAKYHGGLTAVVLLMCLIGVLVFLKFQREANRKRAETLVLGVVNAAPADVPRELEHLKSWKELALPSLRAQLQDSKAGSAQELHAACALAYFDEAPVDLLLDRLPGVPPGEARNLISALAAAGATAAGQLRQRIAQEKDPTRQARYAIALLHLGDPCGAERILALAVDPTPRTAFIHGYKTWHGDLAVLPDLLRASMHSGFRSGLCAAIGSVDQTTLGVEERQALVDVLVHIYREAPDGGTHSAAEWGLRQWQVKPPALEPSPGAPAGRDWFVNRQQMTMLKIPAGTVRVVNPLARKGKTCQVTFTRPFFMCDREVRVDLFKQFLNSPGQRNPKHGMGHNVPSGPTPDCPVNSVSWFDALLFCNWLSRQEGRQECYTSSTHKLMKNGKELEETVWSCNFKADGYRLPTEAEWEFACRAGTTSTYFFGENSDLLRDYGFFFGNSRGRTWPGGRKLPNGWGLFDMYGNLDEWCWDWFSLPFPSCRMNVQGPADGEERVIRGGWYLSLERSIFPLSLHWNKQSPNAHLGNLGFRVVCLAR
jgi:formylglycine-generating enzyme required for sulfatase activity